MSAAEAWAALLTGFAFFGMWAFLGWCSMRETEIKARAEIERLTLENAHELAMGKLDEVEL